jgi:predicted naringenin-chalcone synthase
LSFILDISTAVPSHLFSKAAFIRQYQNFAEQNEIQRKIAFVGNKSGIETRYTVYPDLDTLKDLNLSSRMEIFKSSSLELGLSGIQKLNRFSEFQNHFTDLIFVTCTGLTQPGIELDIIEKLNLPKNIQRHSILFNGCYAGISALKLADYICQKSNRVVLVVCVELCTLHFQAEYSPDFLLSNTLFADGVGCAIVSSKNQNCEAFEIMGFENHLVPDSTQQMSWNLTEKAFVMTLSADVPKALSNFLAHHHLFDKKPEEVDWNIHPGGKKIIEQLQKTLSISDESVAHSLWVLNHFGNMSSATIFFVLQQYLKSKKSKMEQSIAMAFGPGLTLESVLLKNV